MSEYLNDKTPIKVGIVDDHKSVTTAISLLLNSMPGIQCAVQAYSGEELLQIMKPLQVLPDILLIDVEMNGMSGIDTAKEIAVLYPAIKVIAFSGKADDWTIVQMIGAGACAYLSKDMKPEVIEQAIREVHRKGKYQADLYHLYSAELRQFDKELQQYAFSDKETQYLQLLCKGYLWARIAAEMEVSVKSVGYYSTCVSKKLGTKNQVDTAFEALRLGIAKLDQKKRIH